ncbi:hypothetical protein SAMN05216359_101742 [Roseateles sp. YR242]|uniref:hypothetical protein n=1 Tax=Roseateles sp. YR242 TaxID=1855305 RepID=UPI0008D1ADC7|nr:hypothetical protein [Roseateles sp. YR242]SEK41329.1 hypothetical protein SAMN05216359_101742 [Roseateles sp. YR242]
MYTQSFDAPLQVMPADAVRAGIASQAAERVVNIAMELGQLVQTAVSVIGERRLRAAMLAAAREQDVARPAFAESLRRAAGHSWL